MRERYNRRTVTTAILVCAGWGAEGFSAFAQPQPDGGLSMADFEDLYRRLQPPAGEAWRSLPWHTSLLEARAVAAREKKPLYMLVRSGHPLGCV